MSPKAIVLVTSERERYHGSYLGPDIYICKYLEVVNGLSCILPTKEMGHSEIKLQLDINYRTEHQLILELILIYI